MILEILPFAVANFREKHEKTTVLGAGSWGTALAFQLARSGSEVFLWDHKSDRAQNMQDRTSKLSVPT